MFQLVSFIRNAIVRGFDILVIGRSFCHVKVEMLTAAPN